MTAAAGLDQRKPLTPSKGVRAALAKVRTRIAPMTEDRPLYKDIEAAAQLIADRSLVAAVEEAVGPLA
jgi:histidine ammonia-lyase